MLKPLRHCAHCGAEMQSVRSIKAYCSDACRKTPLALLRNRRTRIRGNGATVVRQIELPTHFLRAWRLIMKAIGGALRRVE
jgi:hypothetical protein